MSKINHIEPQFVRNQLKYGRYLMTRYYFECPECAGHAWIEDCVTDIDSSETSVTEVVCQFCEAVFQINCDEGGDDQHV